MSLIRRTRARGAAVGSLAALLAGCAALPYATMTPEQIAALAKIKDASIACVSGMYAGAKVTTVLVNVDKGIPAGMTIGDDCKTTFDTKGPRP